MAACFSSYPREGRVSTGYEKKVAEYFVNFICETSMPRVMPLNDLKSVPLTENQSKGLLRLPETDNGIQLTRFMKTMTGWS